MILKDVLSGSGSSETGGLIWALCHCEIQTKSHRSYFLFLSNLGAINMLILNSAYLVRNFTRSYRRLSHSISAFLWVIKAIMKEFLNFEILGYLFIHLSSSPYTKREKSKNCVFLSLSNRKGFFLLFEMSFDSFLRALYKYSWSHTV